jgi:phenylalanyl-tRNA synthetase alpha chain
MNAPATTTCTSPDCESFEQRIIDLLAKDSNYANGFDSLKLAENLKIDHQIVVGAVKALENEEYVVTDKLEQTRWALTPEGDQILQNGSPEFNLWKFIAQTHNCGPVARAAIDTFLGGAEAANIAINNGMKAKLLDIEKGADGVVFYKSDASKTVTDSVQATLQAAKNGSEVSKDDAEGLKRRKLANNEVVKHFFVKKAADSFRLHWAKAVADITPEMLKDGSWQTTTFKKFNLTQADGKPPASGSLHPLLKVRQEFREIFLELGFQEMETSKWIESSFWNFDALFVPQNHPARDSQDTFFVSKPEKCQDPDADYFKRIQEIHEAGYVGKWNAEESRRNVLRTHTTAVSSWVLYHLAQQAKLNANGQFTPGRYFSIDRVFRNEEMDKTHLCEFHQIEGFIVDRNLSLANMMHTLHQFFKRIGIEKLRFKPAYNPYTEPSMEIFGYHSGMDRWMEVGNSGVFRPEMLKPMGFDGDVTAIAWGLSLERPTMIKYGIKNIHELFGHNVSLKFIRKAPIARF